MQTSVSGFPHPEDYSWGPVMLFPAGAVYPSHYWIAHCCMNGVQPALPFSGNGYVAISSSWWLWMKLLDTFVCRPLGGCTLSLPLREHPGDKCWVIWQVMFNSLGNSQTVLQSCCAAPHPQQWCMRLHKLSRSLLAHGIISLPLSY